MSESKLETQLVQEINGLIHQNPPITVNERLNLIAHSHANQVVEKKLNIFDNKENRKLLFPDALRYEEISVIVPLKGPTPNSTQNVQAIISEVKKSHLNVISNGYNSIGISTIPLPTNELLAIILIAYFKPMIPESIFTEKFSKLLVSDARPDDYNFFMNLLNTYRNVMGLPSLVISSVAEEQEVSTRDLLKSVTINCQAAYAIQVFQQLLLDPEFRDILSDIWTGFSLNQRKQSKILLRFWRQQDFVEGNINLTIVEPTQPPHIDAHDLLHPRKQEEPLQKQRPGRKNPPQNANQDYDYSRNMGRGGRNPQQRKPGPQQPYQNGQRKPQNRPYGKTSWSEASQQLNAEPQGVNYRKQPQQGQPNAYANPNIDNQGQQQNQSLRHPASSPWTQFAPKEPFDDNQDYRRLPADLRNSHTKYDAPNKQQQNKKNTRPNKNQRQQPPIEPEVASQEAENDDNSNQWKAISKIAKSSAYGNAEDSSQRPASPNEKQAPQYVSTWAPSLNTMTPYDDSKDAWRLPAHLKNSHQQVQPVATEPPKKEQPEKKKKNQRQKQPKNPKQQHPEQDTSLKPNVSAAWKNFTIEAEKPKPQPQPPKQQPLPQNQPQPATIDPIQPPQQAEPVQQQLVQPVEVSQEKEIPQEKPVPPKVQAWAIITEESLKQPRTKPVAKQQPQKEPELPPQPEPVDAPIPEEKQPEQIIEPVQEEQVINEEEKDDSLTKNLLPPPETVNAWSTVQSITAFDDSHSYRNTPAEFRHSHNQPKTVDEKPKKEQKKEKKEKQEKKNKNKKNEQPQQIEEPAPSENTEEVQQAPEEVVVQSSWAPFTITPYDDKNDVRRIPPELRRSHIPPEVAKGKEEKQKEKEKKQKKKENKKQKNAEKTAPPKEEEIQQEEPQQEEVVVQQQEEVVQEETKKGPWANINIDAPYDDRKDLSKTPAEFRRSHAIPEPAKKEDNRKGKNQEGKKSKKDKPKNNQNKQKEIEHEAQSKKQVSEAWTSLDLSIKKQQPPPPPQNEPEPEPIPEPEPEVQQEEILEEKVQPPEPETPFEAQQPIAKKPVAAAWQNLKP